MKPFKMLYASSYDRGLYHLLRIWPEVKKRIPTATLEICYGWDLFLRGYANNPYMMDWKNKMDEMMKQEGITHHGRLSKEALDELTKTCDVWAYYCTFDETNCITALNNQKLGVVPVTMKRAGLIDTVYSGFSLDEDGEDTETYKKYVDSLVYAYENPDWLESEREKAKSGIEPFYWDNIAKEWLVHF